MNWLKASTFVYHLHTLGSNRRATRFCTVRSFSRANQKWDHLWVCNWHFFTPLDESSEIFQKRETSRRIRNMSVKFSDNSILPNPIRPVSRSNLYKIVFPNVTYPWISYFSDMYVTICSIYKIRNRMQCTYHRNSLQKMEQL